MTERVHIRAATDDDLPTAIEMLGMAELPTQDLSSRHLALVAESGAGVAGVIGLEAFGDVGLLRSLIVLPNARGSGVGSSLVKSLEPIARERGIKELWLLTIDADQFFSRLNFNVRRREFAPEAIQGSEEFSALCPGDAVLMSKYL